MYSSEAQGLAFLGIMLPEFKEFAAWREGTIGSGVVTPTGPLSGENLVFDFNRIKRKEEIGK